MDKNDFQEIYFKASYLEKQSQELQQSIDFLEQEIFELENFNKNLSLMANLKEREIIASIGKGVHIKAILPENKNSGPVLFVEIGSGVVVKKTPQETGEIVEKQVNKLREARLSMLQKLQIYQSGLSSLLSEIEKMNREHSHSHTPSNKK